MHPIFDALLAQTAEGQQSPLTTLLPFVAIAAVFYFLILRPQSKQRKQLSTFIQGLKKGDEVVTQAGIIGEVFAVDGPVVTLNVGGGTKIRVLKAQMAGPWKEGQAGEAAAEKK